MPRWYMVIIFLLVVASYFAGYHFGIGNQSRHYGQSGLPANCRALISDNLEGYATEKYTAEEALNSIDRNCGPNGYIWDQR